MNPPVGAVKLISSAIHNAGRCYNTYGLRDTPGSVLAL